MNSPALQDSSPPVSLDALYLALVLNPIRVCRSYKPKFGLGAGDGVSLEQFKRLYGQDPFYEWFGLDNPLMYAAHKAAGGMTSIYRQIGIGCEQLFRKMIQDSLSLASEEVVWSYEIMGTNDKSRTLSLDARVPINPIADPVKKARFQAWLAAAAAHSKVAAPTAAALTGAVFEVRQGYKSKDSKRQNADIANAATAYASGHLPCLTVLSGQIDATVMARYRARQWTVLTGTIGLNDPQLSTYDFAREVLGYDLAAFFQRHKGVLQAEINLVLQALLTPDSPI